MTETERNAMAVILRDSRQKASDVVAVGHRSAQAAELAKVVLKLCDMVATCSGIPTLPPVIPPPPPPHH